MRVTPTLALRCCRRMRLKRAAGTLAVLWLCSVRHGVSRQAAPTAGVPTRSPCLLQLRGGGYAYQAPGRRPYVERHTTGQVDGRDVPHHINYEIDPTFHVDAQPWCSFHT